MLIQCPQKINIIYCGVPKPLCKHAGPLFQSQSAFFAVAPNAQVAAVLGSQHIAGNPNFRIFPVKG